MTTKKEQAKKDYCEKKEKFEESMNDWNEDELTQHMEKLERYYSRNSQTSNLLGDFTWDNEHVYYWHTRDNNPIKLEKRRQVGWQFATREDATRAGLEDRRTKDGSITGHSCVEMSHGNCNAVLLKIPRKIFELNEAVKRRMKENKPLYDANGLPIVTEITGSDDRSVTRTRKEQSIKIG